MRGNGVSPSPRTWVPGHGRLRHPAHVHGRLLQRERAALGSHQRGGHAQVGERASCGGAAFDAAAPQHSAAARTADPARRVVGQVQGAIDEQGRSAFLHPDPEPSAAHEAAALSPQR